MDEEKLLTLVAQAVPMPEDERIPFLLNAGVPEDQMDAAIEMIQDVIDYDNEQNDNIALKEPLDAEDRLDSDAEHELEEQAQNMADGDDTVVEITDEDTDDDGDTDKTTIEKDEPKDNSSESEDKPHDSENSTNSIARHLSNYRY